MKRHERISRQARHAVWRCLMLLTIAQGAAVEAVRAWMSEAPWGALALAGALICFLAPVRCGLLAARPHRAVAAEIYRDGNEGAGGAGDPRGNAWIPNFSCHPEGQAEARTPDRARDGGVRSGFRKSMMGNGIHRIPKP